MLVLIACAKSLFNNMPSFLDNLTMFTYQQSFLCMVKSGNLGHQVNSDIHLQIVEILMRRLLMSRLIRIFTVCFISLFFYSKNLKMKQTRSLSKFT